LRRRGECAARGMRFPIDGLSSLWQKYIRGNRFFSAEGLRGDSPRERFKGIWPRVACVFSSRIAGRTVLPEFPRGRSMDDREKKPGQEGLVSRRAFLTSLGKWSSIAVAAAVSGLAPTANEDRGSEIPPEQAARRSEGTIESAEPQWWRRGCRVWGNRGRVWGNR